MPRLTKNSGILRAVVGAMCGLLVLSNADVAQASVSVPVVGSAPSNSRDLGSNVLVSLDAPLVLEKPVANPTEAAALHLENQSELFDVQNESFQLVDVVKSIAGINTVRYRQTWDSTVVAGSLLALTVDGKGSLLSFAKRTSAKPAENVAHLSDEKVAQIATSSISHQDSATQSDTQIVSIDWLIADKQTLSSLTFGSHYVWRVRLLSGNNASEVYIDDQTERILLTSDVTNNAVGDTSPLMCNWRNTTIAPGISDPARSANTLCSEDSSLVSDGADAIAASERTRLAEGLQITTNFFSQYLNIDIRDEHYLGNISPQINYTGVVEPSARNACTENADTDSEQAITTNSCAPRISAFYDYCVDTRASESEAWSCPVYANAFWNPWHDLVDSVEGANCRSKYCSGLYFGRGFAADDIVAHELSHSVIGGEAFLDVPNIETDAISEVFADIFGEAVDQLNVKPGEAADKNWNFGEDAGLTVEGTVIPGVIRGPFRTVRRVESFESATITSGWDLNGEPHENLGPGDRFAWLIANGGKQGKTRISAIGTTPWGTGNDGLCQSSSECTGIIKLSQLSMNALPKLWGASSYYDFGRAMISACNDFVLAGAGGFTASNCEQVRKALVATNILKIKVKTLSKLRKVKSGSTRTVKARVVTSTGNGAANIPVKLQKRVRGRWVTVAKTNTNLNGYGVFSVKFNKSASYRMITVKSAQVLKLTSATRRIRVS